MKRLSPTAWFALAALFLILTLGNPGSGVNGGTLVGIALIYPLITHLPTFGGKEKRHA